ncbi:MAG: methionyl-tRNA formyltransferase [Nannocystaceae bacterium]|nr:methionyl-tRNA formyltransferase [bacterium]
MGSPDFAVPSLHAVAKTCDLQAVVCQPDRPAGRGRKLKPPAVKVAAEPMDVPIYQPTKMKDGTLRDALAQHDLDLIVVTAFGRILPKDVLDVPRMGCINVHASLLPRWRGAAPIQRAVLAGDPTTGVAIMRMEEGLDTGPVYRMVETPIEAHETSGMLFERLAVLGGDVLAQMLRDVDTRGGLGEPTPQDDAQATHAAMLSKAEGAVDWSWPAARVIDHVRGMDPWPNAFTARGELALKLYAASSSDQGAGAPGTVLAVDGRGMHVACGTGAVCIGEVQPAGKRRMSAEAYASGRPFAAGERLGA